MRIPVVERIVGGVRCMAPDYSVPGVKELVEAEVKAHYTQAEAPRNSMMTIYTMRMANDRAGRLREVCDRCGILIAPDEGMPHRCEDCGRSI